MNIKQFVKYGFAGIASTSVHVGIAFTYIYFIDKDVFIANVFGFCTAFIFSYIVQSLVVFEHKLELKKLFRYFYVQFGSFLIAFIFSNFMPLENYYIQTLVISFLLPVVTFFIHKLWTFKTQESKYAGK